MHDLETIGTPWLWAGFLLFIAGMLATDLGLFHRKAHKVELREAALWSAAWVGLAVAFDIGVYILFGPQKALEFASGYLVEKSLSVDNIFVFVVILSSFAVPDRFQHRVLFWGIVGALLLRGVFIFAGAAFVQRFHWALYVFGGIILLAGIRFLRRQKEPSSVEESLIVRLVRKFVPLERDEQGRFFVKRDGRHVATTLLLALLALESTDLVFATDSIPAVFGITRDPFIVFTSNIFAVLGLRSLFFLLVGVVGRIRFLRFGLSGILVFVGSKMVLAEVVVIPVVASLAVILAILILTGAASTLFPRPAEVANKPQGTTEVPLDLKNGAPDVAPRGRHI